MSPNTHYKENNQHEPPGVSIQNFLTGISYQYHNQWAKKHKYPDERQKPPQAEPHTAIYGFQKPLCPKGLKYAAPLLSLVWAIPISEEPPTQLMGSSLFWHQWTKHKPSVPHESVPHFWLGLILAFNFIPWLRLSTNFKHCWFMICLVTCLLL